MSATEVTAHDVETAIKTGLAQLNLLRAEVKIEVLDEGSKGVLGLGARPARVRLTPYTELPPAEIPTVSTFTPPSSEATAISPATETPPASGLASGSASGSAPVGAPSGGPSAPPIPLTSEPVSERSDERVTPIPAEATVQPNAQQPQGAEVAPVSEGTGVAGESLMPAQETPEQAEEVVPVGKAGLTQEAVELAGTLTQGVLDRMDMQVTCTSKMIQSQNDDNTSIWVDIQGKDANRLLAHQNEALDALQLVVQTMWAHQTKSSLRITLDADSYKERRARHLHQMAERLAERVVSTGRAITLEPMPPAERRLVHIALRDHPLVTTESHGEGSNRRVTIRLK